ncbi:MAG: 2-phosphosulfolactate phosphatase [Verrucomicrobiae bacterium]|nr:2-phosphosulfolactate phosphatase [Verrucomicrobiae bacterium]
MMEYLDATFSPAEFEALRERDLSGTACVVFDVLRATSSMLTALANGATAIVPVEDIPQALAWRRRHPEVLLAGERDGLRIHAGLTGGVEFDLGNSPREYTAERVTGRLIVSTTTNGTRALRACARAPLILVGGFLNLRAVAEELRRRAYGRVLLVCGGTFEEMALEDVLAAGGLAELLLRDAPRAAASDAVQVALQLYAQHRSDLLAAMRLARNGRKLLAHPELSGDVAACLEMNKLDLVAVMDEQGLVRRLEPASGCD